MEHTLLSPVATEFGLPKAPANEANVSGVSWAAVIGGAFVTAALSLILLSLGTGLGLASISPWANSGASASAIGAAAVIWLILMQVVASALGGYLAGRLRTKWAHVHSDEVFFRDTAHGFLAWAVAVVIAGAFLASAAASMAGATSQAEGDSGAAAADSTAYFVDVLFRGDHPAAEGVGNDAAVRAESARILVNGLRQNDLSAADRTYLVRQVAARTELTESAADQRLSDVMAQARQAADAARKTAAHVSIWVFIALLTGAFCASVAATIGGRQRDQVIVI
jgi:hypothetical protein